MSTLPSKAVPSKALETFPNPSLGGLSHSYADPRVYLSLSQDRQPDLHTDPGLHPDAKCIEPKSLKLYTWSYRDEGHFMKK